MGGYIMSTTPCSSTTYVAEVQPTSSAGTFDQLSSELTTRILWYLPSLSMVNLTCRKLRGFAKEARNAQLADEGIRVHAIARACGIESIHPACLGRMRHYGVDLLSISSRTDEEMRQEFQMLFRDRLDVLKNPTECDSFLCSRLYENSRIVAEKFFHIPIPPRSLQNDTPPQGILKGALEGIRWAIGMTKKSPSERERITQPIVALLSGRRIVWKKQFQVYGSDMGGREGEHLPVDMLFLPPTEVFQEVERASQEVQEYTEELVKKYLLQASTPPRCTLEIRGVPFIPSGIGSMKQIRWLCVKDSPCASLPESIGHLDLTTIQIEDCHNLTHLPECLKTKGILQQFILHSTTLPHPQELLEDISHLQLMTLYLSSRNAILEHLPKGLFGMHTLKSLCIAPCAPALLEEISGLSLEELIIADHLKKIDSLPPSLLDMPTLRTLRIAEQDPQRLEHLLHDQVVETLRMRSVEVTFNR